MTTLMGNGQPGVIKQMQDRIDGLWKVAIIMILVQVASGGGTVSLKSLLELFGH